MYLIDLLWSISALESIPITNEINVFLISYLTTKHISIDFSWVVLFSIQLNKQSIPTLFALNEIRSYFRLKIIGYLIEVA